MNSITLLRPDDWHCHLRDDDYLLRTVNDTAARFQRALVMPNLRPPITTVASATQYRERILTALAPDHHFDPLMTLYLTESLTPNEIKAAAQTAFIPACKLYPAGATTNSAAGITDLRKIYPLLEAPQATDTVLCIHGESINPDVDVFDRERRFIDDSLIPLIEHFPQLRIVLEHISSAYAVNFIRSAPRNIAATITAHHLLFNRNAIFQGGIRPHYYCLPIAKREEDRIALIQAAISGNPKFFLGTDSAPHTTTQKESTCGCAGIYTAHAAIELYAQIFDRNNALSQLENFASVYGAQFYKLPINTAHITLVREPWQVPTTLNYGQQDTLIPLCAGETIEWKIKHDNHP